MIYRDTKRSLEVLKIRWEEREASKNNS